jgi:hypothetical protein
MSSETSCRARTPLAYVFERFAIERFIEGAECGRRTAGEPHDGEKQHRVD